MRKFVTILLTLLCIASPMALTLSAQSKSKSKIATAVQQSIDRLNSQIAEYERQISSIRKDKKSAQAEVNKLSRLIGKRRKLVSEVNSQMNTLNGNINQLTRQINELSKQRTELQEEYAEMVRVAYRNYRQQNFTTYLFSADDFNSATRRIAAIRLVNDARQRKVAQIDSLTIQLDSARKTLDAEKVTLQEARNKHNAELKKLSANERDYKKRVSSLSSREKKILKAQQEHRRELERIVNSTRKSKGGATVGGNIKDNRGRLPMPVAGGRIKPNGSDIAEITGAKGAQVKSVFNGEVMRVSYNRNTKSYIVLIGHGQYFTTYSNMATATVKEGQKVSVGQAIGTVGQSVDASGKTEYKLVFGLFSPNGDTLDADEWLK